MKYHKQLLLSIKDENGDNISVGSCYPTALACILDLELKEVPYFNLLYWDIKNQKKNLKDYIRAKYDTSDLTIEEAEESHKNHMHESQGALSLWARVLEYWLASMGWKEIVIDNNAIDGWLPDNPSVPYMANGTSPRGLGHVVVCCDGKMIHDPHPNGDGLNLGQHVYYTILVPIREDLAPLQPIRDTQEKSNQ